MNSSVYYLFLLVIFFSFTSYSQSIQIVSDYDWHISTTQAGPFDISPHDVLPCVDETYIDSVCGQSYDSPLLNTHFEDCENMFAIWGIASPEGCYFPAQTYWFKSAFTISESDYSNLLNGVAKVQADNSFTFYLNGEEVGSSEAYQWDEDLDYEVSNYLVEGDNEILVKVANLNGGSCFNYAFLAFCLELVINDRVSSNDNPNPDFKVKLFPNPSSNYISISTEENSIIQNVVIYSLEGKVLYRINESAYKEIKIPVAQWNDGVYLIQVEIDDQVYHDQFVVTSP